MPHSYVSVDVIKATGVSNATSTAYDTRIRQLAEAVSLEIDRYINRSAQAYVQTQYYSGDGSQLLLVNDLISIGSLSEDGNSDGTFSTAWAATDYNLIPFNAEPTLDSPRTSPYHGIEVSNKSNGSQDVFLSGQRNYEIVGTWGYQYINVDSGLNASASFDGTTTSITLDGSSSGTVEVGNTLLVGTEMMYVADSATGTSITVQRGVNGGGSAVIASGSNINVFQYPASITEAALIQTVRLWKRREASFSSQIGFGDGAFIQTFRGLDQDVKLFLNPFRRLHV